MRPFSLLFNVFLFVCVHPNYLQPPSISPVAVQQVKTYLTARKAIEGLRDLVFFLQDDVTKMFNLIF